MTPRRLVAVYFAVQGLAVFGWWGALALESTWREPFLCPGWPQESLLAYAPGDLLVLGAGSLLLAGLVLARNPWEIPVAWLVAGATDYAAIQVLAAAYLSEGGWLGFVLMAPAALLATNCALLLTASSRAAPLFRRARPAGAAWNVTKTLLQIAAFWSFFLGVVPAFLVRIEPAVGLERFSFAGQIPLAAFLFASLSALGFWSGLVMARAGEGTPLPLDAPRRLVVRGPYARVANPMAVSGLGQGMAVAIGLGSWGTVLYVLLGGAIWNWLVRPAEEEDLEERFGEDFRAYRLAVRCWIPRWTPYRP